LNKLHDIAMPITLKLCLKATDDILVIFFL
jgi:hypothetical protein